MPNATVPTNQMGSIIAKVLREPELRTQFLTKPKQTLLEMGIPIPTMQSVTVLESDGLRSYFVLPILTIEEIQALKDSLDAVQANRSARSRILIKVSEDISYKMRLLQDPKAVLQEEGIKIPEKVVVTALENSAEHLYIVIPAIPHHHH